MPILGVLNIGRFDWLALLGKGKGINKVNEQIKKIWDRFDFIDALALAPALYFGYKWDGLKGVFFVVFAVIVFFLQYAIRKSFDDLQ